MRLDLVLTPRRAIAPATDDDRELLKMVRPGDLMPVDLRKVRNGAHHRKLHALITFVAENHPRFASRADVIRFLKFRTGHCREFVTEGGAVLWEPLSISYREMDELAFATWAARARQIIYDELFPALKGERIEREIDEWLKWS